MARRARRARRVVVGVVVVVVVAVVAWLVSVWGSTRESWLASCLVPGLFVLFLV